MSDIICYDYIQKFLELNPKVTTISLPHNQKVDKYIFLREVYHRLIPFKQYYFNYILWAIDSIERILQKILENDRPVDDEFYLLYESTLNKISLNRENALNKTGISYQLMLDILIKTAVLCENVYLAGLDKTNAIYCQTSSYNIDHVLYVIESKFNLDGIYPTNERESYSFFRSITSLSKKIHQLYFSSIFLDSKQNILENIILMAYGEALILIANEHNKLLLKELSYNEW